MRQRSIEEAVERSDICVLGGDLFDFRWNLGMSTASGLARAGSLLTRWTDRFSERQFIYLSGNHDAHEPFVEAMFGIAENHSSFDAGIDALLIRDTLFLHGDVIENGGTDEAFARYRADWAKKPRGSRQANRLYGLAVELRLHKLLAAAAHPNRCTFERLLHWIESREELSGIEIKQVVFGHTHRRVVNGKHRGVLFQNPGAAVRHVRFEPVMLEI